MSQIRTLGASKAWDCNYLSLVFLPFFASIVFEVPQGPGVLQRVFDDHLGIGNVLNARFVALTKNNQNLLRKRRTYSEHFEFGGIRTY